MITVDADLRIDVSGSQASLVAHGQQITLTSDVPMDFWAALRGSDLPVGPLAGARAVGRIADALGAAGLEFRLAGPHGELGRLGSGSHSWWGRVLTGSDLVRLGSVRSLRPVLAAALRRSRLNPRRRWH